MQLDLYWIPVGAGDRAGQRVVRFCGHAFEAITAFVTRRPRCDLFHTALVAETAEGTRYVEMAPTPDANGRQERRVVAAGAVGLQSLGRLPQVPTPVWGRDELRTGEMWNSNSVVSWVLTSTGLADAAGVPPGGGRAPGWSAGIKVANQDLVG